MRNWTFRGTLLDEIGTITLVSDSFKLPKRRGENIVIPFRDGRVFVEKMYEQRTLTLGMEIEAVSMEDLEDRIDALKALLGQRSLGLLTYEMDDGSIRQAQAEHVGDLNLARVAPLWRRLTMDFVLPDTFFRSDTLFSDSIVIDSSPVAFIFTNPGTADVRNPKTTLTGPLENTEMTHTVSGIKMKYNGAIADGDTVVIDVDPVTGEFTAVHSIDGNVIGNVTHEGSAALMVFNPGENELSITDDVATTGSVAVEFYPPNL